MAHSNKAQSDPPYERLGAKVLSLPDVIAQSVGFMGPVFSSAFVIPLVVGVISASGKGGGVASPLSVLIAAVGVFAIGWIVSSYAKEVHAAGSLYDYVTRGLGERVGTAAGWLYYAGVTVLLTGLLLLIGGYLQSTIQSEFKVNPMPGWAWTLIVIALVTAVLYFGVRISVRSQLVLALISIIVVTAFFIEVIVKLGSANSFKPFNPSSSADGWGGIFFGVLYGVLLFVGFETAANLAEETPKPGKHIPAAVMITAGIATVFFLLAAYVEVAGFHYSLKTLTAAAGAPLFALGAAKSAGGYGGTWIDRLLELVVLFDMLAVAIGCAVSASRGIFAMARDRRIPARLAVTSRRYDSPFGATVLLLVASLVTLALDVWWKGLFALPATPHYFALFAWGSTFGGFALVVVYLLMAVGSLRSFAHSPGRVRLVVCAVVAIAITAGAIYGSFYKVTSPTILAPWFALIVLVIGFLSTFVARSTRSASAQLPDLTKSTA
jgi:amino acid transporter